MNSKSHYIFFICSSVFIAIKCSAQDTAKNIKYGFSPFYGAPIISALTSAIVNKK
jgi:hypothetical protein